MRHHNRPIVLKRANKIELIKAVQALEKRGYECICQITPIRKENIVWKYVRKSRGNTTKFGHKEIIDTWFVKMKRIDRKEKAE